jgi:hypothetical protein
MQSRSIILIPVAVVIFGALALWGLIRAPTVNKSVGRREYAKASARGLRVALRIYEMRHGPLRYMPPHGTTAGVYASGPEQNVEVSDARPENLSSAGEVLDPWKHPFVFRVTGNSFTVLSGGPDGRLATADDISSDN